jgi:hypothetical protein
LRRILAKSANRRKSIRLPRNPPPEALKGKLPHPAATVAENARLTANCTIDTSIELCDDIFLIKSGVVEREKK